MYSFVDTHCDTVVKAYEKKQRLYENSLHIDLKRLKEYDAPVQIFAIWLDKKYHNAPFDESIKRIDYYHQQVSKNADIIDHINDFRDIKKNKENKKISGILSIEGGEALEGKLENLYRLHEKGVRAMTLTWNYKNCIGSGAGEKEGGLTEFGYTVVREMERLDMLVDVSHLNDDSFWDVVKIAEKPFFASHSNSRRITNVRRNLTDAQMKAVVEKGGMIGINLCGLFLSSSINSNIDNVLKHIDHMMKVIGCDNIGFGFDFDGVKDLPEGVVGVEDTIQIIKAIKKKYGDTIAKKISEENFLNYFSIWAE